MHNERTSRRVQAVVGTVSICLIGALSALTSSSAMAIASYSYQESFTYRCNSYVPGNAPVAVAIDGTSGAVYAAGYGLGGTERFNQQHECQETLTETSGEVYGVTVVQRTGDVYATDFERGELDQFGSAVPAMLRSQCSVGERPTAVAIDETSGDIYVMKSSENVVDKLDASCKLLFQIRETPNSAPIVQGGFGHTLYSGLAVDQASGDVFVGDAASGRPTVVDKFGPAGEFLLQFGGEHTPQKSFYTNGPALALAVDPSTGNVFVADRKHDVVDEFSGAGQYLNQFNGAETPAGAFEPQALGIDPTTGDLYVGDSTESGSATPLHEVIDVFNVERTHNVTTGQASSVGASSATLNGTVNPAGVEPTSCAFEYGLVGKPYEVTVPCAQSPAQIGSGSAPVPVSAEVVGLQSSREYHFRLITNVEAGRDGTFFTPVPPALSDEAVGDVTASSATFSAAINPGGGDTTYRFEYGSDPSYGQSAPAPEGDAGAGRAAVVVSAHVQDLSPAGTYHFRLVAVNGAGTTYGPDRLFSTRPPGGPFALPDGRLWELVSPSNKNGAQIFASSQGGGGGAALQASMDGGSISYSARGAMGEGALGNALISQILSRRGASGWSSQDISTPHIQPKGATFVPEFHFFSFDLSSAIVIPRDEPPLVDGGAQSSVYVRDNAQGSYALLDGLEGVRPEEEWEEAMRVWYAEQLAAMKGWYFQHEAGGERRQCEQSTAPTGEEPVIGVAYDGCDVYFVSKAALAQGASAGMENLYVAHGSEESWSVAFIAALSEGDERDWAVGPSGQGTSARVSPNGRYVAFMSNRSLTGYDNTDVRSGAADEEVFLYDSDTARLVCASCNPTGERPTGLMVPEKGSGFTPNPGPLIDHELAWESHWLAGSLTPARRTSGFPAYYQPRNLSDSGRLFFDSPDALVTQDVNGRSDIYEYEPRGTGSCVSSDATFVSAAGGCISLISSGLSSEESAFLDASLSGGDAFFLTRAALSSQDTDTSFDVYDAHLCTQGCALPPAASPACDTSDSCRAAPLPQPSVFGASPSATFEGAGNLRPSAQHAPRRVTAGQKLARALRACRRKRSRARRRCVVRARRRYARPGHSSRRRNRRSK